jgi:hypothetical protein
LLQSWPFFQVPVEAAKEHRKGQSSELHFNLLRRGFCFSSLILIVSLKVESVSQLNGFESLTANEQALITEALKQYLVDKDKPKPKKKRAPKRKAEGEATRSKAEFVGGNDTKTASPKRAKAEASSVKVELFPGVDTKCSPREAVQHLIAVAKVVLPSTLRRRFQHVLSHF